MRSNEKDQRSDPVQLPHRLWLEREIRIKGIGSKRVRDQVRLGEAFRFQTQVKMWSLPNVESGPNTNAVPYKCDFW